MIPAILIMRRMVDCLSLVLEVLRPVILFLCLWRTSTVMMMINTVQLKRMTTIIGARNAAKKAAVLLMKQLCVLREKTK